MTDLPVDEVVRRLESGAVTRYRIVLRERIRALRFLTTDDHQLVDDILALIDEVTRAGPERGLANVPGQAVSDPALVTPTP